MDKKIKTAAGVGFAALAIAVAGGGYYYFHVHSDTPEYAIEKIEQALDEHDTKAFHRVVDVDSVLYSGYNGFVDSLTSNDGTMSVETRDAIKNFVQMFRAPMVLTMRSALDSYVATGKFSEKNNDDILEILEGMGFNDAEIRDVKNIQLNDADRNEAFADFIIFQPELAEEFPLRVVLTRGEDKQWKLTGVQNFQEYVQKINGARRLQLEEYISQAAEINSRHDVTLREAEKQYGSILSLGDIGLDKTRADVKNMVSNVLRKDWEERKRELFALRVPKEAAPLHNLYMQICDTATAAADDYIKWLDDRNSATMKSAEEKIRRVHMLLNEANALAKRMIN